MRYVVLAALFLVLLGGCATAKFGKKFTAQDVARIQYCVNSRAQLVAFFGEPMKDGIQDGYPYLLWQWADMELGAFDSTEDSIRKQQRGQGSLIVFFDQRDMVVDYVYNPVAFPRPTNRCLQKK
jgi:hypothetical protein